MARITFGEALGDWGWLEHNYSIGRLELVKKSDTRAVYRDQDGDRIVFTGRGLKDMADDGESAVVRTASFLDAHGRSYMSFAGLKADAADIVHQLRRKDFFSLLSELTSGHDTVRGTNGSDDLVIGANRGSDRLFGRGGDDVLKGSAGSNVMSGGSGWDILTYKETWWDTSATRGIVLDIKRGTVLNGWGGRDRISGFEEYQGSFRSDRMKGSARDEAFVGFAGNDVIDGRGGNDSIRYHQDRDFGSKKGIVVRLDRDIIRDGFGDRDVVRNVEGIYGTDFKDRFIGDAGANTFRGLSGTDRFDGRGGRDWLSFEWWETRGQKGVEVDLSRKAYQIGNDGYGNREHAFRMENIEGSRRADRLTGDDGRNDIVGGEGRDRIDGGGGRDWLEGGGGADIFIFSDARHSRASAPDKIGDFSAGEGDRIHLLGLGRLDFIGEEGFSGTAGELRYQQAQTWTLVQADRDGDGKADVAILLRGRHALTADDFIL